MIIVTGATGFIGRRLIQRLVKSYPKDEILCLIWDKNTPLEKSGRLILKNLDIKTKYIDLVTKKGLQNLPKNPRLVFHLAANTETNDKDHRVNDIGTKHLVEALGPLNEKTHFLYVSTTAFMAGRKNCQIPFNEKTLPAATNEYSRTKLRAENYMLEKAKTDHFRLTVTRLGTVFGEGPRDDSLFDFMKKQVKKQTIISRLNWPGLTSLVYVDDVAKILVLLSKKASKSKTATIFILYAESLTLANISKYIHESLGFPYKPITIPSFIWKASTISRLFIPLVEKIVPLKIYNLLWRGSIIIDDVIHSNSKKIYNELPAWKPVKLKEKIKEVLM